MNNQTPQKSQVTQDVQAGAPPQPDQQVAPVVPPQSILQVAAAADLHRAELNTVKQVLDLRFFALIIGTVAMALCLTTYKKAWYYESVCLKDESVRQTSTTNNVEEWIDKFVRKQGQRFNISPVEPPTCEQQVPFSYDKCNYRYESIKTLIEQIGQPNGNPLRACPPKSLVEPVVIVISVFWCLYAVFGISMIVVAIKIPEKALIIKKIESIIHFCAGVVFSACSIPLFIFFGNLQNDYQWNYWCGFTLQLLLDSAFTNKDQDNYNGNGRGAQDGGNYTEHYGRSATTSSDNSTAASVRAFDWESYQESFPTHSHFCAEKDYDKIRKLNELVYQYILLVCAAGFTLFTGFILLFTGCRVSERANPMAYGNYQQQPYMINNYQQLPPQQYLQTMPPQYAFPQAAYSGQYPAGQPPNQNPSSFQPVQPAK